MNIVFLSIRMQDCNIPWSVSNITLSTSAPVVQCGTTHALDMVVEPKLDMPSVLIPVLGSDTSVFFHKCLMIFCFWFLREYISYQDLVAGDCLNADTRRRQLILGKKFKTRGKWMECVQRLDEAGYPRSKDAVVSKRNRSVAETQRVLQQPVCTRIALAHQRDSWDGTPLHRDFPFAELVSCLPSRTAHRQSHLVRKW